jgi:hypothetical protein
MALRLDQLGFESTPHFRVALLLKRDFNVGGVSIKLGRRVRLH